MNLLMILAAVVVAMVIALPLALMAWAALNGALESKRGRRIRLANIAEGRHANGVLSKKSDAVIAERYRLAKFGSDVDHVDVCGAADVPIGIITDLAEAIEDPVSVRLLGSGKGTEFMVASAAIALGALVEPAANGRIATLAGAAGTHYVVGRALNAAANAGDLVEVDVCLQKIVTP